MRLAGLKPFYVMEVLERAKALEAQGRRVVHLEIGEPDFDAPECVKAAACKAIADNHSHYTHSQGLAELRQAICDHYARRGAAVEPERVFVTSGTSAAMVLAFAALLGPGRAACITDPGYACYASFIAHAGGSVRRVPVAATAGFHYDTAALRAALDQPGDTVAAVVVNSPANPTGSIIPDDTLGGIARLAEAGGFALVADEIYHGLADGEETTALALSPDAWVLDGFSKRYAMTGWRLGWLVAPAHAADTLRKLAQNLFICAGSVAQWAGLAAMQHAGPDVQRMRAAYATRRALLVDGLLRLGFAVPARPAGAFYVLADARPLGGHDSLALALDILDKALVGVAPGIDFGPGGEGYLRFSCANSLANIQEGLERLGRYLERR